MQFPFLLDMDPATKWMAIAVAVLFIFYAVFRPMMRKKDPLKRPPAYASLAQQRSVERQMQNVLVELSEMSRQITAQLDTRATKLEMLIKEADEKIARMQSISAPPAALAPVFEPADSPAPEDPRHAEIYSLADKGRSSNEIARELNRPSGEIELILALRR